MPQSTLWTIGAFLLGYFLHLFLNLQRIVKDKTNAATSVWELITQNVVVLLIRLFFSCLLFWTVRTHPELLVTMASWLGVTVSENGAIGPLTLVTNIPLSSVFGYEADSLLGYIPFLANQIPQLPGMSAFVQSERKLRVAATGTTGTIEGSNKL